jgi:hypothetical protein
MKTKTTSPPLVSEKKAPLFQAPPSSKYEKPKGRFHCTRLRLPERMKNLQEGCTIQATPTRKYKKPIERLYSTRLRLPETMNN